jgi:GNAT superfamily N-acetyltransferase
VTPPIRIREAHTSQDLRALVHFPWHVYQDDPFWVPPLISQRVAYLTPGKNPFYQHADVALFLAVEGRRTLGTIAAFEDHHTAERSGERVGNFGFFEVVDDYDVAERLLDTAREWAKERGLHVLRGPINFINTDCPGVLIGGAECPPVMFEAHTPPYYRAFLERYGMAKHSDLYAWRAFRSQVGPELSSIPDQLLRVAEAARQRSGATIRKVDLGHWDEEVELARHIFNSTLSDLPDHVPIDEPDFRGLANQIRAIMDPDLALVAEVDGEPVGFCLSLPDINRALIHINGRLLPLGWLKLWWYRRRIDVVSCKMMGIRKAYRRRGIDALLYLETLRAVYDKGYQWLDGSLTSEHNTVVNHLAQRFGAERYKHYRIYEMPI